MYLTSERDLYSCEATLQEKSQKKFRGSNGIQTLDLRDTGIYRATKNRDSNVLDICISNGAFYFPRYQCRSITSSWITPYHRQVAQANIFTIFFSVFYNGIALIFEVHSCSSSSNSGTSQLYICSYGLQCRKSGYVYVSDSIA